MKAKNFFSWGPPWVTNSLSAVISLLILVDQLGPQIAELFGILNCTTCLTYLKQILAIGGAILAILKIFMKAKPKITYNSDVLDNQSGRKMNNNLPKFKNPPPPTPQ